MGFFLANPWGLLALAGIPAVVAIHLLRRKSREVRVSTLFLVEQALPSSEGGRRIRRLRNSLPLWVQMLAVAALAWLLAQPRWIERSSKQTVVAVFDASASAGAFRTEILAAARRELARLGRAAGRTRWVALRSDGARLAAGPDLAEVLAGVEAEWDPTLGAHDAGEAFRLARTLAGPAGTVAFFTDHATPVPGVAVVAAGNPLANAGFLGASAAGNRWQALLKNFSREERELRWRVAGEPGWHTVRLAAGATADLSGEFPAGTDRVLLESAGDGFGLDDTMPIVRPAEKPLSVRRAGESPLWDAISRVAAPVGVAAPDDVTLAAFDPLSPAAVVGPAVVVVKDFSKSSRPLRGAVVRENHPLMADLNWQGLTARESFSAPFGENDVPLLWQGTRPLVFLRPDGPQLVFNFDVEQSNATHLPAFPILLHRFFSQVRADKVAYAAANVETRQSVSVAGVGRIEAPARPGFFAATAADGTTLFDGAAEFGDARESDFSAAATGGSLEAATAAARQSRAAGDHLDPLWAALAAAFMVWNWVLTGRPRQGSSPAAIRSRAAA